MDLNKLVQEKIKEIDVDGIFQKALAAQLEETIKKVLKDAFGPYSALSKQFEKLVEEKMKFNPSNLTLPQYSNFVVEQANLVIQGLMDEDKAKLVRESLAKRLVPDVEKEIEFTDLVDYLSSSLLDSIEDADTKYLIKCEMQEGSGHRTSNISDYWVLTVSRGGRSYKDEIAVLFTNGEQVYHSRGEKDHPIAKRFASYQYLNAKIIGIEPYERSVSISDKY